MTRIRRWKQWRIDPRILAGAYQSGMTVSELAQRFAVTPPMVRKRLKKMKLIPAIPDDLRDLYRKHYKLIRSRAISGQEAAHLASQYLGYSISCRAWGKRLVRWARKEGLPIDGLQSYAKRRGRLTQAERDEIYQRRAQGERIAVLAADYRISLGYVSHIYYERFRMEGGSS